jgi:hypothetical protein
LPRLDAGEVLIMRHLMLVSIVVLSSGCSLVLDDKVGGFQPNLVPDMELALIGFDAHVDERVEVFLISDAGFVQGHAVLDPMPDVDFTIELEDAYMDGVDRIDFWADNNGSGDLTAPRPNPVMPEELQFLDHMWRTTLGENGQLDFIHNTDFTYITTVDPAQQVAGDFSLRVTDATDNGDGASVRVFASDTDIQKGFYFLRELENDTIDIDLEGIIEEEVIYTVEIAIGDEVRCADFEGTDTGLSIDTEFGEFAECPEE